VTLPKEAGMSQRQRVRFTRAAQIGLATLVFVVLAAIGIYFGANAIRGGHGYQTAVRFPNALGVAPGSQVFMNGVNIGSVSKVRILRDGTVDFILHISRHRTDIPKDAAFSVQGSLGGAPNVVISAPTGRVSSNEILPKYVAPISEQPVGKPALTIESFMLQSRALGNRLTGMLAEARPYGKPMLSSLQNARSNAGATAQELRGAGPALLGTVQSTVARAKNNIAQAREVLQRRDQSQLVAMRAAFQRSANDMQQTSVALRSLKRDPQLHDNVRVAKVELRAATANLAQLSYDMAIIAKNPQTKAELLDAGARFRVILKRI
jgi:paraquat-inducible protein B